MYKSLQAGRAIAAMLVVLYHLGGAFSSEKYFDIAFFGVPFSFGRSGVEFFFVLSGFIILTAHRQDVFNPARLWSYLGKRIVRIYPTYWIIFLGAFLLAIASAALRNTVPHDPIILLKSLLLLPQDKLVVGGTGAPVIIVAWTLQYELLFYAFFATMILSRALATALGLAWLAVYVLYHGQLAPVFPLNFLASNYSLLFFFGMGVSLAVGRFDIKVSNPRLVFLLGALLFTAVAFETILGLNQLTDETATVYYGIASAIMIFGLVRQEETGQALGGAKWMQLLGDSSYALYLIHFPLISILCKLAMLLHLDDYGLVVASITYLVIATACVAVSVLFHLGIEKPVIAYLRQPGFGLKRPARRQAAAPEKT